MDEKNLKKQGQELEELRKFFLGVAPILDKLDKNPELAKVIMDHDFLDITPPKKIGEIDETEWRKYMVENWNFIEYLQNYTIEKILNDFNEKFSTENILKNDMEEFIKSLKVWILNIHMVGRAYENNKQK